ncbi:MAG: glycosyltransferase [bacterium]|nr:glycosyltransferase [bacterium]
MFTTKKIAIVSVINDLATDHRVYKSCLALLECDYDVLLIGRKLPNSPELPLWPHRSSRMTLIFRKGPLFYFFFNVRLFFLLLFRKADLLYANDLDTLLPNFIVSRLKKIPLIYDSHELYTEVPELQHHPLKRKIWKQLERWIVPQLKHCVTVNESIARVFENEYHVPFCVVRNIPDMPENFVPKSKTELGLPLNKKLILLQGTGINVQRGAEELVDAMMMLEGCLLLIIGSGDVWPVLKEKIKGPYADRVRLIDRLSKSELMHFTHHADIGISIDKDTNLNYLYSLPNKVFDYIQAGIPILASRLPEIEKIINTFGVGDFIPDHVPQHIANKIHQLLNSSELALYKQNTSKARLELNWGFEKQKLIAVIRNI